MKDADPVTWLHFRISFENLKSHCIIILHLICKLWWATQCWNVWVHRPIWYQDEISSVACLRVELRSSDVDTHSIQSLIPNGWEVRKLWECEALETKILHYLSSFWETRFIFRSITLSWHKLSLQYCFHLFTILFCLRHVREMLVCASRLAVTCYTMITMIIQLTPSSAGVVRARHDRQLIRCEDLFLWTDRPFS